MAIEWDPRYAVDVPEIDLQHQEIFHRVGVLLAAMKAGKVGPELGELVGFLEQYVVQHFAAEEQLMAAHRWPHLEAHRAEHQRFIREFAVYKRDFEAGGATTGLVVRLSTFVTGWLTGHITSLDRAFGRSLSSKGTPIPG